MTVRETPVFFPSGNSMLAGILTVPEQPNGLCVVVPWGAGAYPSSARNRIRARLARAHAADGFHAFRFDYEGVGESEGTFRTRTLDDIADADIEAACGWLTEQGLDRHVIVANCFGAWSTLLAAPRLPGLRALAMINAPVKHGHAEQLTTKRSLSRWMRKARRMRLGRWFDPDVRAGIRRVAATKLGDVAGVRTRHQTRYVDAMRGLSARQVPCLVLYGNDGFRNDFEAELASGLAEVFDEAGPLTRSVFLDRPLAGYPSLAVQEEALAVLTGWVREVARSEFQATGGRDDSTVPNDGTWR